MKKTKCELCGKYELSHSTKEINKQVACHDCWKKHIESNGLADAGCINPNVAVCSDREPGIIDVLPISKLGRITEKMQNTLDNAICYAGHEECQRRMDKQTLFWASMDDALDGKETFCEKCGLKIEVVKTDRTVAGYCPSHGMIWHGILDPENKM